MRTTRDGQSKFSFRKSDRSRRLATTRTRPTLEWLEGRTLLTGYVVTNTNYGGNGSLGAAIIAADGAGDPDAQITFNLASDSTITLTSANTSTLTAYGPTAYGISGGANITINGSGAPGLTIDGGNALRLFAVTSTSSLTLENLTVSGGLAQGFAGGQSAGGGAGGGGGGLGGAVYDDGGAFTAEGVTFTNNTAKGGAGGSVSAGASIDGGGGGGIGGAGHSGTGGGTGGNGGGGNGGIGGGVHTGSVGGFGGGGGGGAHVGSIEGAPGGAGGFGGGGAGGGAGVLLGGPGGAGGFGGGAGLVAPAGIPEGNAGGGGAGLGGGIFSNGGVVTLVNDTFTANTATGGAGGAGFSGTSGTGGSGYGGAVFAVNGTLSAKFVTFSGNTAENGASPTPTPLDGSDVYVLSDSTDAGVNGTGTVTATLIDDILGQTTFATSDFVANSVSDGGDPALTGQNDLISNNSPSTTTYDNSTGLNGTDIATGSAPPLAGAGLANNGGPTDTIALTTSLPGIVVNGITTDQRGVVRSTTPDIGAFELAPVVTGISPTSGPATGGTTVTITGLDLSGATAVEFGTTAVTSFTSDTATQIVVVSPAGADGTVDVTVVTPNGTSGISTADEYTYTTPSLVITPTTLNLGTTPAGTPSAEQSYLISGTDLAGDVTIAAPTGIQISNDGGLTWQSSLTEVPAGGVLASSTIEARINSTLAGNVATPITNNTPGLAAQDVTLTGTITATAASQFVLTGLIGDPAGTVQSLTVEAEDQYGNEATTYTGTVHFTSSDSQAVLPANYTFTNGDGGLHTFTSGVTLKTAGPQTVTAADTVTVSITGTSPSVIVTAAAASDLVLTGLTGDPAGTAQTLTVEVEDQYGNETAGYTGQIHFTSTDLQAVLPANYTFTVADAGQRTFTSAVTLETAGSQTVTATDTGTASITGTSPSVIVTAAAASHFVLTGLTGDPAGTAQTLTVDAEDAYGNEATGYTGTVHFTSTDLQAVLPANYTFTVLDNGQHTFTGGVTLETAGSQTVTATDTDTSITGTSPSVLITAAAANHFVLAGLSTAVAGTAQTLTVEAEDQYGNEATSYTGTVHFTSTDLQAGLPVDYTFVNADGGLHTFMNGVTLKTAGSQTVTATDTVTGSITGTSPSVLITPAAASQFVLTGLTGDPAGTAQTLTVEAEDQYGNKATGYTGHIHFTSTDLQADLPVNYTFTFLDDGQHTFTGGVTLETAGSQTVTATDTDTSITGTSPSVLIAAAAANHFVLSGLSSAVAGTAQSLTVEAEDQYGNEATGYTGTVDFTSTDLQAGLPTDYTFTIADGGLHTFTNGVTLKTTGPQTVTATDTDTAITGTSPSVIVTAAAASQFVLTGLTGDPAGTAQTLTVEAEDQYGNEATAYTGTVHFTSTDLQAGLPANYTFTVLDGGLHTFTNGVTLKTAGSQTVTATDTVTGSITGTSPSVIVTATAASQFVLTGLSSSVAGTAQSLTVEAEDQYGNEVTDYTGQIHFTSTDPQAVLPANYTFTVLDDGQHTFTGGVTVETAGSQTVTATDTDTSITGTSPSVLITAAAANDFVLTGLVGAVAGTAQTLTVEAEDAYGNKATTYTGTVHFTSTDLQAGLPANYAFTNADGGEHTFTDGVTLDTAGMQSVTATDTVTGSITRTSPSVLITAAAANDFVLTGLTGAVAGTAQTLTVEAEDAYGNEATTYTGTVHFTSTDLQAGLPANYAFTNADGGEHTFTDGVTLDTAGMQSVTATDTVTGSITGTSASVLITPGLATQFVLTGLTGAVAGTAQTLTVEAEDQFGNEATTYTGTVHFTSTDLQAGLPINYTFTNVDGGEHTFTDGVTLKTAGPQTVTATDTDSSITGTSPSVLITAAAANDFVLTGLVGAAAGTAQTLTVEAEDAYGNEATGYTGMVHFTSTDLQAGLPINYTFTNADGGEHTFTDGVTLDTAGMQSVTATDTVTGSITGTSPSVLITPAAASHFVLTGLTGAVAGTAQTLTVEAEDAYGNDTTGYTGTVHFTSSDLQAGLPANYAFVDADDGVHTFPNGVTLKTAGSQTVTATDTDSSITGISPSVPITAAAANDFVLTGLTGAVAGTAQTLTVEAEDAYGNEANGYTGTIHVTSTDSQATLPVDSRLTDGTGTFSVTIKTAGSQTVTATDTVTGSITGTSPSVVITPDAMSGFLVTTPTTTTAGIAQSVTVEAEDAFGNEITDYTGTIAFTSTDGQAVLPANYTFLITDDGQHTFTNGVTLKTAGVQTVTAADTVTPSYSGTSPDITVNPSTATHLVGTLAGSAGSQATITVTALDAFGNVATGDDDTIDFTTTDPNAVLPTNNGLNNGVGTFVFKFSAVGTYTATFTDADNPSISGSLVVTIPQATTGAGSIVASPSQSFHGQTVTLTATFIAPAIGTAQMTGTVAFYDGTTYLGTAPLNDTGDPTGTSSLSTSALPVGTDSLTADYSGDVNYSSATVASPATVQVSPATTSTTLSSATTAQGTILTADVVVTSSGNPPITGTVSFYDGTTLLGTESATSGVASLNIGMLSAGSHSFRAVFSGGGTSSTSASTLVVSVVSTDGPTVTSVLRYGFHDQSTFLVISFNSALAPAAAENAVNYTIVGPAGRRIKVRSALYDAATNTVTLKPAERINIHRTYRLTINGTTDPGLTNLSGTLLDGAGNGHSGTNYVTSLTWRNLAGRARQRPTLSLVHAVRPLAARAESSPRRAETKLHRAAVDHLLATESLHVVDARRARR